VGGRLIVNDSELGLLMVRQGVAMAQVFEAQVDHELRSGALVRVLEDWQLPFSGFHIYYHTREQLPPKLRVFIDYLREVLPPP
jgi:Transcriptional regulator